MRTLPCLPGLEALRGDVLNVPLFPITDGSGRARGAGTREGWISGLSMARVALVSLWEYPVLADAVFGLVASLDYIPAQLVQIMVNRLEPGCALDRHRDGLPSHERWHLPVITNPEVVWWDELGGDRHMEAGSWHGPVPYCGVLHSMRNGGPSARYHVVVDVDGGGIDGLEARPLAGAATA